MGWGKVGGKESVRYTRMCLTANQYTAQHMHANINTRETESAQEREREREGQTEDTRKRGGGGERKIDRQRERERERERERGREGAEDYPCRFETLARTRSQLVAVNRGRARWRLIAATFPCL